MKLMLSIRFFVALLAGVLLYQTSVVVTGGVLAAIGIPRAYFAFFGRQHQELALAVLQFVSFALPVALIVAGGTLAIQRLLGRNPKAVLSAVLAGLVLCFAYWTAVWVFQSRADLAAEPLAPSALLTQVWFSPWWAASGFLAPWLGFALAAWLILRNRRS
jgi:hypothetical protein